MPKASFVWVVQGRLALTSAMGDPRRSPGKGRCSLVHSPAAIPRPTNEHSKQKEPLISLHGRRLFCYILAYPRMLWWRLSKWLALRLGTQAASGPSNPSGRGKQWTGMYRYIFAQFLSPPSPKGLKKACRQQLGSQPFQPPPRERGEAHGTVCSPTSPPQRRTRSHASRLGPIELRYHSIGVLLGLRRRWASLDCGPVTG